MDLHQLRYFRVVARVEHMTRAAEELHISQPSLSKTIHRLEDELGVPLFDRQGRSIQINQFGKAFLEHVDTLFRELEQGQRKVRELAERGRSEVSVVAASLIWLPDLLQRFQAIHPAIHFQLSQCPLTEMPQRLETGACDFCFLSMPLVKPGIKWQPLLTHEIVLVVSSEHHLARQKKIPLGDIANEVMVIEKSGSGLRDLVDDFCQQAGFTPRIEYEIDDPTAIFEFVKANLGVAFAPVSVIKQLKEHDLTALHLTNPICECTFGIAWHKGHYLSEAARIFQQFVVKNYANQERATKKV